jgi:hypothetical protein
METGGVAVLAPTTTSAFTTTLRISQAVYEVTVVGEQTRDLLDTTKHIVDSMSNVRIVRRQKSSLLTATEKEWIDYTIESTEKAINDVGALIEPARVDMQTKPSGVKDIRSKNRVNFVLRDSPNVAIQLTKLSIATQGLNAAMGVLCNREGYGDLRKLNGGIIKRIEQRSSSPSKVKTEIEQQERKIGEQKEKFEELVEETEQQKEKIEQQERKIDWGKGGPPKPIMRRRAKGLAHEFATREGTFRLGIGEPAFDDLDMLGLAVSLDDGNAEGNKDPEGSTPESPPVTVNTIDQDDTKQALEYHTEVLDGTPSPTKRPSLEEVKEAESESLWQHERQRRIVLYFLNWHFPSMYGAICGVVTMALLTYLFGAYELMTVLWIAIPIAVCLRRFTLPRGLSKSLHHILVSPIVAFRCYLPMAKKLWRPSLQAGYRRIEWVCVSPKIS